MRFRFLFTSPLATLTPLALLTFTALTPADVAGAEQNRPAPNCPLRIAGGPATSVSQLRGKVLYLDFWASWCIPCAQSFPFMNGLHGKLREKGLQVVGINLDEKPEDANRFLGKHPARFAIAMKSNESCAKKFSVPGMPYSFVVDRKGTIRHVHSGFNDGDAAQLQGVVTKLLAEPVPDDVRLVEGKWRIETLKDSNSVDATKTKLAIQADGTVTTSVGCHELSGKATLSGNKVTFGSLAPKGADCAPELSELEQTYTKALAAARSFRFDGKLLKLADEAGADVITFAGAVDAQQDAAKPGGASGAPHH